MKKDRNPKIPNYYYYSYLEFGDLHIPIKSHIRQASSVLIEQFTLGEKSIEKLFRWGLEFRHIADKVRGEAYSNPIQIYSRWLDVSDNSHNWDTVLYRDCFLRCHPNPEWEFDKDNLNPDLLPLFPNGHITFWDWELVFNKKVIL